jgi:hypothetical protein
MAEQMKKKVISIAIVFITSYSGGAMAVEEPKFSVEGKMEHYEIRKYEPTLVAETVIKNEFDKVGNQAFHILADYIFGNNKSKTKIEMTAPVSQQPASEKIEMTAPVTQANTPGGFLVQFTLPEKLNLSNVPEPNDPRVRIRQIPARRVAVYGYSGSWSEDRYKNKLADFISLLKKDGLKTIGEPTFARFNSPFMIWFLRRNEIWFELGEMK